MSLYTLMRDLAHQEWAMDFAGSSWPYPTVLATHLCCIAFFGGMILLTNLRLLGWALTSFSISDVVGKFRPWKRIGFVIMISAGLLLGGSEADKYYPNPYFWTKMILLVLIGVHGLVFRPSVYLKTAELDRAPVIPRQAKVAASLSLILWIGVVCMGRMIGYYEAPNEQVKHNLGSGSGKQVIALDRSR